MQSHYLSRNSDWPEQYIATGWVGQRLFSVIFEIREDDEGEFYHLVTLWKATHYEEELYAEETLDSTRPPTADEIADMADQGEDVTRFFIKPGKMMPGIQRVNVDFTLPMLAELERQAVIKTLQALDQHYLAQKIG